MNRPIMISILTAAILAAAAPAMAGPADNSALREAAAAGQITPRGVWDSK